VVIGEWNQVMGLVAVGGGCSGKGYLVFCYAVEALWRRVFVPA
jgi:hypothetical protein